jgi:hypothetical protein
MGRRCAILLVLGSGCAQLLGIDPTTGGGGGDANPGNVSIQVQRITVGPMVARTPENLTGLTASFLVPDSTDPSGMRRVPGVLGATTDTWTAAIPDGTPAMEITLGADYPDKFRRLYAFPQRAVKVLYGVYEQPGSVDPPANATLMVTINLPSAIAAGEGFQLYALGGWANHGFSGTELGMATTQIATKIPYVAYDATAHPDGWGSTSGRPLKKLMVGDEVLALRYLGAQLTGAAEFAAFDQTGTDAISANMLDVPAAALDVHVSPTTIANRLAMPSPAGATLAMNWSVNAAPGWQIANGTGPQLEAGGVAPADSGAITVPFGNPFAGHDWRSVFTWASSKSRTFMVPGVGNLPATLYTGINQIAEVAPGLVLDPPAPIPVLVTVAQVALGTDGKTITIDPTKGVDISLVADIPTPALFYQFNIYELRANATNTAAETHVVYVAQTTTPKITIPNDVLVAGKWYQLRAHCVLGGYPSFGDGNLWDRNLPYSVGYLDAGVFTVAN